ncbi:MAG: hypothetical protein J6W24_07700 [Prevotella sp.]|nr:hypothetical protein [Prevotella sp.]
MVKKILYILLLPLFLVTCSNDDNDGGGDIPSVTRRTIIIYFAADNNLSTESVDKAAQKDLEEIVKGSKNLPSDCKLVVFMDTQYDKPYIAEVSKGKSTTIRKYTTETSTASGEDIREALQYIVDAYPAQSYGLVLWGHGTGSIISNNVVQNSISLTYAEDDQLNSSNAYGVDVTNGSKWINTPTLATTLSKVKDSDGNSIYLDYIFFDACLMMSAENAYELRYNARYIIGATCETPSYGAPYVKFTPILGGNLEDIPKKTIDAYIDGNDWSYKFDGVCLSAVDTKQIGNLLTATNLALETLKTGETVELSVVPKESTCTPAATSCIYYYKVDKDFYPSENDYAMHILYDINDVMKANLSNERYKEWYRVFDEAVVYARCPRDIRTSQKHDWIGTYYGSPLGYNDFYSFYIPSTTYKCLSFLVPLSLYKDTRPCINTRMYDYEWCREVGWKELGW